MSITTKTGDQGKTFFIGQKRLSKSDSLIEVYGSIDELQAFVGWLRSKIKNKKEAQFFLQIEKDLYLIMTYINHSTNNINLIKKRVLIIEKRIFSKEKTIPKFGGFVLPGKNEISSIFHLCRVICRRTERQIVSAWEKTKNKRLFNIIPYFNRLSDLFFIEAETN